MVLPHSTRPMTPMSFARPTIALLAAATIAACHSGGATKPATAPAPTSSAPAASSAAARPAATNGLPAGVTARMVAQGDSLFHAKLQALPRCGRKGRTNGPDLTASTHLQVERQLRRLRSHHHRRCPGRAIKDEPHTFAMRPRGGGQPPLLTDDQIKAVAAYVYSLSHK